MKGILYLFFTTLKNAVKEFFKRPAKVIAGLFFVAMLVLVIVSGQMGAADSAEEFRPIGELQAIILALYAAMFYLMAHQGLSAGASFYSMADVSLLFSCPISNRLVLLYGLIRQMGTSLLVGLFLLFQYSWVHSTYGLSLGGLVLILVGYALTMFCGQLTAMVIYSATAGDERRRKNAKMIFYIIGAAFAAGILVPALRTGTDFLGGVITSANAKWTVFIPVAGWLRTIPGMAMSGGLLTLGIGLGLTAAYIGILLVIQTRVNSDFYEDVLKATEISFTAITAKKEGKMAEAIPLNVKVGKTGLGPGKDVFFRKHLLEGRRSGFFLFDIMTVMMAVMALIFSYILREEGVLPVFLFTTYLQMFTALTGRWVKELTFPYVYLIPQPAFRKLLCICKENMLKIAVDAVIVMLPAGLFLKAGVAGIIALILARIGFGILFMAGNILVERIFGSLTNKVLIFGLYFLTMILLAAPGAVLGGVLGVVMGGILPGQLSAAVGYGITFIWNLLVSAIIGYCCRNILSCAELNNR